ncbi:unnamed protein product [Polarella glacialis]|uniref:Uncharacterized protein n=1 Tax=Polarella glacialis TaxID=89957 RepID=A0A813I0A8_POLGL|nr:unnamed protein product [Polarella glacialis]
MAAVVTGAWPVAVGHTRWHVLVVVVVVAVVSVDVVVVVVVVVVRTVSMLWSRPPQKQCPCGGTCTRPASDKKGHHQAETLDFLKTFTGWPDPEHIS